MQLRTHHTTVDAGATTLSRRCLASRAASLDIARPLSEEDQVVQAFDDASPTKWHLAHTTWFYETFVLRPHLPFYSQFDPAFAYCFNSYYESQGPRHPRPDRGLLTRPSLAEVQAYRAHVDSALDELFSRGIPARSASLEHIIELGIAHEEQHQELMFTDILALFAKSPLHPAYRTHAPTPAIACPPARWIEFPGGIHKIGADAGTFSFDSEGPAHATLLTPFALASRLVTNGEWLQFMTDGGYREPSLWLADGWHAVRNNGWEAPAYWQRDDAAGWRQMTLSGLVPVDASAPVAHVSYYEADAFARWARARLPTEQEWEVAARHRQDATTADRDRSGMLRPQHAPTSADSMLVQMFGVVWQWTASAYLPYPRFKPLAGAAGEYNGKFMCGQHVVRGSSCVTTPGHSRASYRSFFYPHQRWQFTGLRLARDLPE